MVGNPLSAQRMAKKIKPAVATSMLRMFDDVLKNRDEQLHQQWERYFRTPGESQAAFCRTDANGLIETHQDSVFFAETLMVFAKRRDDEVLTDGTMFGEKCWMRIEDLTSNRNMTDGKSPRMREYADTGTPANTHMVPWSAWAPNQVTGMQFDYAAVLPVAFQIPRAGVMRFSFWLSNSFQLTPTTANGTELYLPVTLIGRKIYG